MKEEYKTVLITGGLAGVLCCLYFLLFYLAGITIFDPIMEKDNWIPIIAIFFSIYYYRNGIGERGLKFLQGIWMGLMVNFVIIVVVSSFLYLLLQVIDPDYFTNSIKVLEAQLNEALQTGKTIKVPIEELKSSIEQLKKTSSTQIIVNKNIGYMLFGFPATLVFSILFRK